MLRLIGFITFFAIFLVFIILNLGNTGNINFGFVTLDDFPVSITALASFFLGMVFTIPLIITLKRRKAANEIKEPKEIKEKIEKPKKEKKKKDKKSKDAQEDELPKENEPYGIN